MKITRVGAALAAVIVMTAFAFSDSQYRDPQGRFTLIVPTGWSQTAGERDVKLVRGRAYAHLLIVDGTGSTDGLASSLVGQIGSQWKSLSPETSPCRFGGQNGVCMAGKGVNPAGAAAFLAIYAVTAGGKGYAMIVSGSLDEASSLGPDLQKIAEGFTLGAGTPAPPAEPKPPARQSSMAPAPTAAKPVAASGTEYRASDGSFTCRVPSGWKARAANIGGTTVQVLEPENGGDERILVSATPSTANSLQELAQQAITLVTQQLLPGYSLAGMPKITQQGDMQVVEISYVGMAGGGQASWWHGLMLKDQIAMGVLGGARADRAQAVEEQCRTVLYSMRPRNAQNNTALAAAILGKWTFYSRSNQTGGSVNKQIIFYPNGRFEYSATTYIPDMPPGIDPTTRITGTYQIIGNTLLGRADNGQQATSTLEFVPGGGLKINGELFIREQ